MMLQMSFHQMLEKSWSRRYERIGSEDNEKVSRPRQRWAKRTNGRLRGVRISRSRKLNWKAFSLLLLPRRLGAICAEVMKRMKMEDVSPGIVFSCQWGLPVLSHSPVRCRRPAISFNIVP